MYDARTRLSAAVADEVREHFGDRVLRTAIPRSVRVSEAPSYGQSVITYDPTSPGAFSYLEAAREMSRRKWPYERQAGPASWPRPGPRIPDSRPLPSRAQECPRRARVVATAPRDRSAPTGSAGSRRQRRVPTVRRTAPTRGAAVGGRRRRVRSPRVPISAIRRPTRASRARSSTRMRWRSWSTRSARSDCSSRSSCVRSRTGTTSWSWASAAGGPPRQAGLETIPAIVRATERRRAAARRAAGEPPPRAAQPARRGRRLPAAARRLRVHPRGAGRTDRS